MEIVEDWDHPCEKRAERRVGKDLDDEVDIKSIEDQCAVLVHGEVRVKYGSAGINGKKVGAKGGRSGDGSKLGGRPRDTSTRTDLMNRLALQRSTLEAWRVKSAGLSIAR